MEIEDKLEKAKDELGDELNYVLNHNKADNLDNLDDLEYNITSITQEYVGYLKELKWELKILSDKKLEFIDLEFYLKALKKILIIKQEKASIEGKSIPREVCNN